MVVTIDPPEPVRFRQGAGRLCLDFVRTLRMRGTPDSVEELAQPEALASWVFHLGPCGPEAAVSEPSAVLLHQARELREAVCELLQAARDPEGAAAYPDAARRCVNRAAAQPVPVPVLGADRRLRQYAEEPVAATLALIARDALDLVASPMAGRVRECAGPRCGALFLDSSRPGTRRWCSMDTCGNHAKKAAFRGRTPA